MSSLEDKYNQLKRDYESYQRVAEETMQKQSCMITELDKKLNMLSLIVEISGYINQYLGSNKLLFTINDIMIGILGVTYSSVYLYKNNKLELMVSNLNNTNHHFMIKNFNENKGKLSISLINSRDNISEDEDIKIHSCICMPVYLKESVLGAIVVEHNMYNYLTNEHVKLLTTLSNQLAICIENNKLYKQVKEDSEKDFLTTLYNRSYFFSVLNKKLLSGERDFSIVMVDIDDFKRCNDTCGHQFGDLVLKSICKIISSNIRKQDIIARYGGEEIIIYLHKVNNAEYVYSRMESVRRAIESTAIRYENMDYKITVSIGISISRDDDKDLNEIIERADVNLYKAKNLGKNKVVY
ncbi:sensor domain-containing diguanylate cyclase [Clostridium sp. JN-1]|jgi:diguanylate cyclase (GGDEF)-like protein|uniref:sensor domain-containing diguanylate cyclase n=1 Tax=Clostridium sp. JN-1 TaxID=2483110 RepID=UPI000F0B8E5E|nr:sensor domain-containing diguanylate cyclase [Clostridium sp. JN-1]